MPVWSGDRGRDSVPFGRLASLSTVTCLWLSLDTQREGTPQEPQIGTTIHVGWSRGRGLRVTRRLRLPASFSPLPNNSLRCDRGEHVLVVFHFLLFPWSTLGVKWTNDTGRRRELE